MTHELVKKHLKLDNDGVCAAVGHTLIPRACVHCGLTIHEISDANNGRLPMRDSPTERAERKAALLRDKKRLEKERECLEQRIEEVKGFLKE